MLPARRRALARALSILGHPAVTVPTAVALGTTADAPPAVVRTATIATLLVVAAAMAYSAVQVGRGRWTHVDASVPAERRQLNAFLAAALGAAAIWLWSTGQPEIGAGLAAAGVIVGVAEAARRWLKLSLHVAFAVFSATLLWPQIGMVAALVALAAAVAWSRLVLGRHTIAEVTAGGLLGGGAGVAFRVLLSTAVAAPRP